MNKSNFKQIFLTLALLITAATGAWAEEDEQHITITAKENYQFNSGSKTFDDKVTVTFDGSVDHDDFGGNSWILGNGASITVTTAKGYAITRVVFGSYEDAVEPFQATFDVDEDNWDNTKMVINGQKVASSADYVSLSNIEVYYIKSIDVTTNAESDGDLFTTAWFEMPASDVTVEYSLVRDMIDDANPVEFGGLPADGDIIVKKGNDGKYQPASELTITLIDSLAAADKQNIIDSEDITIQVIIQKENDQSAIVDSDEEPMTLEAFLADMKPGYYRLKAIASETGAYDGTVYSVPLTTVEKYDLLVQPADEYSKDKLSEVTVAGATQPIDAATGKATVTNVAPGAEVKLKANRGYVIESVEAKKVVRLTYPIALSEVTADYLGSVVGADGNIYDSKDAASTAGTTAVAMIAYVGNASDCTNGLAIALADESGNKTWSAAIAACTGKTAVTGGTWRLPSIIDWQNMFIGCGASGEVSDNPSSMSYSGLASKLSTAGGTALQSDFYWSSTESSPSTLAWYLTLDGSNASFNYSSKSVDDLARAVLAF